MAWQMSGRYHEFCNCKLLCPCLFDVTAQPDEGWCGSAFTFDIQQGRADGVDLSGQKACLVVNIPGSFAEGNFTGRLYMDDSASEEQRRTLEEIFTGKRGGPWEAVSPVFANWLPTKVTTIDVQWGDNPSITVGDIGKLTSEPRKDPSGTATRVEAAEALLGFQLAEFQPAKTTGSRWNDPDLRSFEGDSGFTGNFNWQV